MLEKIKDILGLMTLRPEEIRTNRKRIDWDSIFLLEALLWSYRSHDPQTQCGCVLVRNRTVLSTGYNGFIGEIDDSALPNLRPSTPEQQISKNDFMIHAEHNAILNCAKNGISTCGATAYITGEPCNWCFQYMWQANISNIVYSDFSKPKMVENDKHTRIRKALLCLIEKAFGSYPRRLLFIPSSDIDFSPIRDISQKFVEKQTSP